MPSSKTFKPSINTQKLLDRFVKRSEFGVTSVAITENPFPPSHRAQRDSRSI